MSCEHTLKIPIDDIIRHGFFQKGYMPATGSRCRFDDVLQDIEKFYKGTDIRIPSKYQLRSIMDNDAIFMHEIVTILVFLGMSVDDVFSIEKSPNDIFLEKIEAMHKSGMTVNEISTKLDIDAQIVKYNLVVNVYHIV